MDADQAGKRSAYKIEVNVAPLERILQAVDPGGFLSNELGVAWVDDGSGVARKLVGATHGTVASAQLWKVKVCPTHGPVPADEKWCPVMLDPDHACGLELPREVVAVTRPDSGTYVAYTATPLGAVSAAAAVIEAWDTWMSDMRGDEDDQASFHMLRDAIDHLRGGR